MASHTPGDYAATAQCTQGHTWAATMTLRRTTTSDGSVAYQAKVAPGDCPTCSNPWLTCDEDTQ